MREQAPLWVELELYSLEIFFKCKFKELEYKMVRVSTLPADRKSRTET